jgi:uncharacterized repeat protein (TIGR01451 family)
LLLVIALLISIAPLALAAPLAPAGESIVGDYVWFDFDGDGDYVGDPVEQTAGVAGVALELWRYDGATWVLDATTTTTADGKYEFAATGAGTVYEVRVAASNFQPGGSLYGYVLTSASTYLQPFTMPPQLVTQYLNADFGFINPLRVEKVLSNTTPYALEGETVTFRITVSNVGPVTLDPVPLEDFYSPACLNYVTARDALPDTVDETLGRLFWENIGPLDPQSSIEIEVDFTAQQTQEMYWQEGGWQDYAPKGIPDFDQKQAGWDSPTGSGQVWYRCAPVAAASSLWWFDSKYESTPVTPPSINDTYPLVPSYDINWDDHDPRNVPPLVDTLATLLGTTAGAGTTVSGLANGLQQHLINQGLAASYAVAEVQKPTFAAIADSVRQSSGVILLLGFWQEPADGAPEDAKRVGGHYVTVAGADIQNSIVAFSDPYRNNAESGGSGRILPGAHPLLHPAPGPAGDTVHNDAQFISFDTYPAAVTQTPGGVWGPDGYTSGSVSTACQQVANFFGQNLPSEFADLTAACDANGGPVWTEVEYAVVVTPNANTVMCSPTTNIATVTGAQVAQTGQPLAPAQSEASVSQGMDLGDLPDPAFPTLIASNGARHLLSSPLVLGVKVDTEGDGQPSSEVNGDDSNGSMPDDEDGVTYQPGLSGIWSPGAVSGNQGGSLEIVISGGAGVPQVFMEFGSGMTELVLRDGSGNPLPTSAWLPGAYQVYFDIPVEVLVAGSQFPTRVRLSSAGALSVTGLAPDGEVEDYVFGFGPNAISVKSLAASPRDDNLIAAAMLAALLVLALAGLRMQRARAGRR